jgi:hypothetical protein
VSNVEELEAAIGPPDPAEQQRNPHQTFLLLLSVGVSWPLAHGRAASGLLERELDDRTVAAWGIALLVGSALALAGQYWTPRPHWIRRTSSSTRVLARERWTGLVVERAGLILVTGAAAIYAGVVYLTVDGPIDSVLYILLIQIAYALSCGWRCWQITKRLRWLRARGVWG